MFQIDEIWDILDSGLSVFRVCKLPDSQSLGFFETLDFQNLYVLEIRVDNKFGILEIRYLQNLGFPKLEFSKIFPKFELPKISDPLPENLGFFLICDSRNMGFPKFDLSKISNLQPENLDSLKFAVRETRIFQNSQYPKFEHLKISVLRNFGFPK